MCHAAKAAKKPQMWVLAVVLAGGLFARANGPQVPTGTWAATGAMSQVRTGASGASLPDGTVLITGGLGSNGPLASVERYDVNIGAFVAARSMSVARSDHASVVLQNGRVLVAGGRTTDGEISHTAEIYDPPSNSWSPAGEMVEARLGHTASLLPDGRVVIAGGRTPEGVSDSLEIFDVNSNTFALVGTLSEPRRDHASAVLNDGRVFIAGGSNGNLPLSSVDIFDPIAGSTTPGPNLLRFREGPSATTLPDGKVLIAGGHNTEGDEASADIYDPAIDVVSATTNLLTTARRDHLAFLLPHNNNVLIVGGTAGGTALSSAELFAPWTSTFSVTGSMSDARARATGSALTADGLLLVAGGSDLASAELFGFATLKTDKPAYEPGETVTITGTGWEPGETVNMMLEEVPRTHDERILTATADASGSIFNNEFQPEAHDAGVRFYLTARGGMSEAQATFTDPPGIDLEQCRNGPAATPNNCVDLGGSMGWVTGNANATQAHYIEGYSVPYRAVMTDLPLATSITLVLGYDIKQSNRHAIDYLTHYERLEPHAAFGHPAETVTPTSGVSGVSATTTTFPIPAPSSSGSPVAGQPTASFNALPANERVMTLFGGAITGVSYVSQGSLTANQSETRIAVTFTVTSTTAVLAWGGHIAKASDWGTGNSASGISGSPYHMRLISWNLGNLGNQDRSLAAAAVAATGTVVITKTAQGGDDTFNYSATGSGIPSSFSITTVAGTGSQTFADILTGAKTVSESAPPAGWGFSSLVCSDSDGGTTTNGQTANIDLDANQTVSCTFTNTKQNAALTLDKTASPSTYDMVGDVISYSYLLTNTGNVTLTGPFTVTDDKAAVTCPPTPTSLAPAASTTCTASYVITQLDLDAGSVTNTATGHAFSGTTVVNSNPDSETVTAEQTAALNLDKTATPPTYDMVGDVISYSYLLTNTGNVTLTGPFTVTDDKATVTCPPTPTTLAPGASTTCTASYVITQLDLDAGSVTNTATGHGFFGATIVNSNPDSETVIAEQGAALNLDKTATPPTYDMIGDVISYSYLLTNTGNVTLTGPFTVTDNKTAVTCPLIPAILLPTESTTCTASYVITQLDLAAGAVTNTAKGHAFFPAVDSNEDSVTVTAEQEEPPPDDPVVVLTMTTSPTVTPGSLLPYTLDYANVGPAPSQSARIVDYLPLGVTFVSASNGGTYNAVTRTVTWNLGTVPISMGSVNLVVRVSLTTPAGTVLLNRAEFTGLATQSPPTAQAATLVVPR